MVGDGLTRLYEANFSDPNSPELNRFGFLFGARLLDMATRAEIKDEIFAHNLRNYIKRCTLYDIMLGRKNLKALRESTAPWSYITTNASVARMMEYKTRAGDGFTSAIVTCRDAVTRMNSGHWTDETRDEQSRIFGVMMPQAAGMQDPNRPRATFLAMVDQEIGQMHQFLTGASKSAVDTLRDQMVINMYHSGVESWNAEHNNQAAVEAYRTARLGLQTRQSYEAIAGQAQHWVPVMRTVFQAMFIALFPIAALLMLTPMGTTILRNYFLGFVWLESWAALFAVLHYMMNIEVRDRVNAVTRDTADGSAEGLTMFAQVGVQTAIQDVQVMAGYLSMSVPFIALIIAAGPGRALFLATSTLAVSQEAVGETTRETATGNFQLGNTQLDTHAYANKTAFQQQASLNMDMGHATDRAADGQSVTATPGGSLLFSGGMSNTASKLGFGSHVKESLEHAHRDMASLREDATAGLAAERTAQSTSESTFAQNFTDKDGSFSELRLSNNEDLRENFETVNTVTERLSEEIGLKQDATMKLFAQSKASGGWGLPGWVTALTGLKGKLEAEGGAAGELKMSAEDAAKRYHAAGTDERFSAAFQGILSAQDVRSASDASEDSRTWGDVFKAHESDIDRLTETQNLARAQEESLSRALSQSSGWSQDTTRDWTQAFVNDLVGAQGPERAKELLSADLSPADQRELDGRIRDFAERRIIPDLVPMDYEAGAAGMAADFQNRQAGFLDAGSRIIDQARADNLGLVPDSAEARAAHADARQQTAAEVEETRTRHKGSRLAGEDSVKNNELAGDVLDRLDPGFFDNPAGWLLKGVYNERLPTTNEGTPPGGGVSVDPVNAVSGGQEPDWRPPWLESVKVDWEDRMADLRPRGGKE